MVKPASAACLVAGERAGAAFPPAGEPASAIVRWRSATARCPGGQKRAVAGDLVAADATTADPALLELADVICSPAARPLSWLTGTMERLPGCAVAAAPAPGHGYLIVARGHCPLRLSYDEQNKHGLRAGISAAFACAVFVHAWLAAAWSLDSLDPPCLEPVLPWTATSLPAVPLPFVLDYSSSS
jgi:hypothetical protein